MPAPLAGMVSHADHGEDLIIKVAFDLLGVEKPSYLDLGAFDPISISNTALLYWTGSRGINIEANPDRMERFNKLRPEDMNLNCAVGVQRLPPRPFYVSKNPGLSSFKRELVEDLHKEIEIDTWSIHDIISGHHGGTWPHLVSIDIEGDDVEVIGSCLPSHGDRPTIVVVEHMRLIQDWSDEWRALMPTRNYTLFMRTRSNMIWAANEAAERLR